MGLIERVSTDYVLDQLRRLSPPGVIWRQVSRAWDGTVYPMAARVGAYYRAIARAYATIRNTIADIFLETRVATASRTLPHWFQEYGLPEPGQTMPLDVPTQRSMLLAKMRARRGQSPSRLLEIPAAFGIDNASIVEHCIPGRPGVWRMIVPGEVTVARADYAAADDPLVELTETGAAIEAQVRRAMPAHTVLEIYDDFVEV